MILVKHIKLFYLPNLLLNFIKGGVNNIHGLPGILSGITSAVVAALATQETYGDRYFYLSSILLQE